VARKIELPTGTLSRSCTQALRALAEMFRKVTCAQSLQLSIAVSSSMSDELRVPIGRFPLNENFLLEGESFAWLGASGQRELGTGLRQ